MLSILANHNDDIKLLIDKGYALSIDNNYLVIRDIPYLDNNKDLQWGAIVSKLVFVDKNKVKIEDHQIFFCGYHPCELDGSKIKNLGGGVVKLELSSDDLSVQRSFSNKPPNGFKNWYDKIENYVTIISGPAIHLYDANPLTFRVIEEKNDSVFKFSDTLTSRAEIGDLTNNFKNDKIAIIGLGGTGSYLLDFLVKTPVKQIRAYDGDWYHVHNSYRSPGRLFAKELGKKKADIYKNRYRNFRKGIKVIPDYILSGSESKLKGITFAFVCVDKGASRSEIFDLLVKMKIPFIDVGMGLDRTQNTIGGSVRTTYCSEDSVKKVLKNKHVPLSDIPDDIYKSNIQIAELNALSACLAIIKFKQLRGFYNDNSNFYHMLFNIDSVKNHGINQ
ncbi:ThiF family adenylyltransferase [Fulvivirga lutea]|uniref:ThiF family adenylyltransferase n=1 Tax=Fulvivirga lutea TaxID=2810512 RepID=A0A974ZZU2_9BACT|nr:ThiF family adenylyltransferase [Fulvivirga lutea]QSE96505.1 ThiF family adenylyltransferase [Fulvivirga lutea]